MPDENREVAVTDVKIPFWSMVVLTVKWAVAAFPALIILLLIGAVATMAMSAIFGGGVYHWEMNRWWVRQRTGAAPRSPCAPVARLYVNALH